MQLNNNFRSTSSSRPWNFKTSTKTTSGNTHQMTSRQPSHQNFTALVRRTSMAKWTLTLSQQNNIDTSSRLDGSSDLDLRPPLLMTSMTLQDLSLTRQDSLPRDTANTSRTTSSRHSQHRQAHHGEHYFYMQSYISTKSHHVTSHQHFCTLPPKRTSLYSHMQFT